MKNEKLRFPITNGGKARQIDKQNQKKKTTIQHFVLYVVCMPCSCRMINFRNERNLYFGVEEDLLLYRGYKFLFILEQLLEPDQENQNFKPIPVHERDSFGINTFAENIGD